MSRYRRIRVEPEEVEQLLRIIDQGRQIKQEPRPLVHAVIDRLDRDQTEAPYPYPAHRIAEMVGYDRRSVVRQRSRRRSRHAAEQEDQ